MHQTQQPQVTHNAILQVIQRQLLTLEMVNKKLWALATGIVSRNY